MCDLGGLSFRRTWLLALVIATFDLSVDEEMKNLRLVLILLSVVFLLSTLYLLLNHNPFRTEHTTVVASSTSEKKEPQLSSKPFERKPVLEIQQKEQLLTRKRATKPVSSQQVITPVTTKQPVFLNQGDCLNVNICPYSIQNRLKEPILSPEEYKWCKNALDPEKGAVIVGKSWGNLNDGQSRKKFEALSCNNVNVTGGNPSCADSWGDEHVINWRNTKVLEEACSFEQYPSIKQLFSREKSGFGKVATSENEARVECYRNEIQEKYCTFTHAQLNFSAFERIKDPNGYDSTRKWYKNFLTIPCNSNPDFTIPEFKLDHLFSPTLSSSDRCDVYFPGVTIVFSHDIVMNLAHTLNDIMNAWLLSWLEGIAHNMKEVRFMTIDSLKSYHNWDDVINQFFYIYKLHFKEVLRGYPFAQKGQTVCFEKLITPSLPVRGFVWQQWNVDALCSFIGPSTLFQRFNVHVRRSMGLFPKNTMIKNDSTNSVQARSFCPKAVKVVLINRNNTKNMWGNYRSSRVIKNIDALELSLQQIANNASLNFPLPIEVITQDFEKFRSYEAQIKFMSDVSILIGTHGAGIAHLNLMSIGSQYCCGVVEFFPQGEFFHIRGFGNMARRMGIHYQRIEIDEKHSKSSGFEVNINTFQRNVLNMLENIREKPSCILPDVVLNPYMK